LRMRSKRIQFSLRICALRSKKNICDSQHWYLLIVDNSFHFGGAFRNLVLASVEKVEPKQQKTFLMKSFFCNLKQILECVNAKLLQNVSSSALP